MKIIVLGAYGKSGRAIVTEAEKRGHNVLAVARRKHDDISYEQELIKSTVELTEEDITDYDVIIDGISAWTTDTFHIHKDTIFHIANLISGTNKRYIKIGGTSTTYINKEHTKQFKDWDGFPKESLPRGEALAESLRYLRTFSNMAWTYATPAYNFDANGKPTGKYTVKYEELDLEDIPSSYISYADFATALIDSVENKTYIRQRVIFVGNKEENKNI